MFAEMLDDVKRSVQVNLPMLSAETLNKLIQNLKVMEWNHLLTVVWSPNLT